MQERPLLGAGILLVGITCAAMMDVCAKLLVEVPVWQVTWARFFFHALALSPLAFYIWRTRPPSPQQGKQMRRGIHVLRGLLLALSSIFFFISIRDNPLPDALAIFFVEPLLVMLLARFFLKEAFDRRLLFSAVCGMLGVVIILRPGGSSEYEWTILFSLAAALSFAGYIVAARFASQNTPAPLTSWLTAIFGLLPTLPVFLFWHPIGTELRTWGLMAAVGVLSGVGHTFIILALQYLRASRLAVLHYTEIGIAAVLSWFVFAHWPDVWVWSGIGVIAAANLYALRNKKPSVHP